MNRRLFVFSTLFFLGGIHARAADVSLAWDASISPNVTGYKIYVGNAPRNYTAVIALGNQTTHTVTGLSEPATYYFTVTCFDAEGNESDYSNEVSTSLGFLVTSQACAADWYGVVCLVTTSINASAIFQYRKLGQSGDWSTVISTPTPWKTQHRAVVYETEPETYFEYKWIVTDAPGDAHTTSGTFRTR